MLSLWKKIQAVVNNLVILNHDNVSCLCSLWEDVTAGFKASLNVSWGWDRANDLLFKLTEEQEDPCGANLCCLYHEFNAGREENLSLNPIRTTRPSFTSAAPCSSTLVLAFAQWHLVFLLRLFLLVESAQCWNLRFRINSAIFLLWVLKLCWGFIKLILSRPADTSDDDSRSWLLQCRVFILEHTHACAAGGLRLDSCALRHGLQDTWMQQHSNIGWLLLCLFQMLFLKKIYLLTLKK